MCLLLCVAMFIKGPIVCAFLLPGILIFQWRTKSIGETVTAWCGWWPWLASIGLFVVWVAGGILFVPGFLDNVVIREFMGRFGGATHRAQPFYFYTLHLLHRFAPWSLLLIWFPLVMARKEGTGFRAWLGRTKVDTFWLAAWSVGALFVMSVIPSKRVDRIYPIVPPLCLLLGAWVGRVRTAAAWRTVTRTCTVVLVIAALITSSSAVGKMIAAYRRDAGELAKFGGEVRREAAIHRWNYGVVGGEDEGMLLYLRQLQFLDPETAATEWQTKRLDGLVIPERKLEELLPRLPGAIRSSIGQSDKKGRYVFLVRS